MQKFKNGQRVRYIGPDIPPQAGGCRVARGTTGTVETDGLAEPQGLVFVILRQDVRFGVYLEAETLRPDDVG